MSNGSVGSLQDLIVMACDNPAPVVSVADLVQHTMSSVLLAIPKTAISTGEYGQFKETIGAVATYYKGYKDVHELMKRVASGVFGPDDLFREIREKKLSAPFCFATGAAFAIDNKVLDIIAMMSLVQDYSTDPKKESTLHGSI
jgi:hypothetical protein